MYETLLHRLQRGLSKHPLELVYVSQKRWPIPQESFTRNHLRILVLDSSFNPPTLAHLALANIQPPVTSSVNIPTQQERAPDYDARLLLLSVRNPDKTLQPGDASYLQRLNMMQLFAQGVKPSTAVSSFGGSANVAIGIIDEPTFVGKASTLQAFLQSRFTEVSEHPTPSVQLDFVLGFDTLERILQPRYYASREQMIASLRKFFSSAPEGDDSRIICAQRSPSSYKAQPLSEGGGISLAQEWFLSQHIITIDIGGDLSGYSSSEVRKTIQNLGLESQQWKKLVADEVADYIVRERLFVNGAGE